MRDEFRPIAPGDFGLRPADPTLDRDRESSHTVTLSERRDGTMVVTLDGGSARPSTRSVRHLGELIDVVQDTQPARIVVDLRLPMGSGASLLRRLKARCPRAKMLVPLSRRLFSVSVEQGTVRYLPWDGEGEAFSEG